MTGSVADPLKLDRIKSATAAQWGNSILRKSRNTNFLQCARSAVDHVSGDRPTTVGQSATRRGLHRRCRWGRAHDGGVEEEVPLECHVVQTRGNCVGRNDVLENDRGCGHRDVNRVNRQRHADVLSDYVRLGTVFRGGQWWIESTLLIPGLSSWR